MDWPGVLVLVAFAAVIIALAIYAHKVAEKRKLAIAAWAQAMGFSFSRARATMLGERYGFADLNRGENRYAHNISSGRHGEFGVSAFDYHYETYSRDSKGRRRTQHHNFSAVILETALPLKPLSIRAENFFDKIGEFIGFDDIDFELAEFSREFHVKSPDRKWAFDVLHQDSMEFLLASPRFQIELLNGFVMARSTSRFAPETFGQALLVASGLIERLPKSVVRELTQHT
jgi:hypothetical protein